MSDALKKRSLGESTTVLFDNSAVDLLRRALRQPQAGQVLYAMHQLEQLVPEAWPRILAEELPQLLEHAAVDVRQEALRHVLKHPTSGPAPLLRARLEHDADPRVVALLMRVLGVLQDSASLHRIAAAAESGERTVQAGAIIGLLSVPDTDSSRTASSALQGLIDSPDVDDRVAASEILGQLQIPTAVASVEKLLRDDALVVRHAALRAARKQLHPRLISPLFIACADPACSRLAELVLSELASLHAEAVVREARKVMNEEPRSRLAHSVLRVLGSIQHADALGLLHSAVGSGAPELRLQALLSLSRLGYRAPSAAPTLQRVREEVAHAAWLAAALQRSAGLRGWSTLRSALETDFADTRGRILLLLAFIYDARAVLLARNSLGQAGSVHSAIALETIDALLPASLKPSILPLLEDIPHDGRLRRWRAAGVAAPTLADADILHDLIDLNESKGHPVWSQMCALHVIGLAAARGFRPALEKESGAVTLPPAIDQMRRWALARLSSPPGQEGDGEMLSLVERVLILKSAPLFAGTSDSVLAELAGLVDEVPADTDQVIFHKGDPGDSLYVIISGSVRVWDGDRLLNELKEGEAFGELALLDPEPRLGTVKASEPTNLLRLDSPSFKEVLDSQPEVSSAILRVVTKYLRSQLEFAREATERIRALESLSPLAQSSG
jgi:hypothetical protein